MYKVVIEKVVEKFLKKHPDLLKKFLICVRYIQESPVNDFCDTKKMKWYVGVYRLRIGKYRFLYRVVNAEVIIYFFDAGSRGDVY